MKSFSTPEWGRLAALNTAMAFVIAFVSLKNETYNTLADITVFFVLHQVYFHLISFGAAVTSFSLLKFLKGVPVAWKLLYITPAVLAAILLLSLAGMGIVGLAGFTPGGGSVVDAWKNDIAETVIIAVVMSFVFTLSDNKNYLEALDGNTGMPLDEIGSHDKTGMEIRESGETCFIRFENIFYISAHGKVVVVHAAGREYRLPRLLGDVENMLPPGMFLRIHKSFIVNPEKIVSMKYYAGGSYTVLLNDAEETVLPVSRSCREELKKRLQSV